MKNNILLADFGSTFTKLTLINLKENRVLGSAKSFTTIDSDITKGFKRAKGFLEDDLGKISYEEILACSSAAGGLKMIAIGLVPQLTLKVATQVALNAGAKLIKTYSYELTIEDILEIEALSPDIILLAGGTDGGNKEVIIHNGYMLSKLKKDIPTIFVGNRAAKDKVTYFFKKESKKLIGLNNILASLDKVETFEAKEEIRKIFLKNIVKAKGLEKISELIGRVIMPTPLAVFNASKILALGTDDIRGIGEIVVVDVGGATTDVCSIASGDVRKAGIFLKGIKEPYTKRTVEGDLGLRYSLETILKDISLEEIKRLTGIEESKVKTFLKRVIKNPSIIPNKKNDTLDILDNLITEIAIKKAIKRHSGRLEKIYTPAGLRYFQEGKDLSQIPYIVGTGGPIINRENPKEVLKKSLREDNGFLLKPKNPKILLDKKYLMAAMGLLGERHPENALLIMKKEIIEI